jgi:hypothetical protein
LAKVRRVLFAGAGLWALVVSVEARAADNRAAAEALFAAGRSAAKRGDVREACTRFRESHRLDPAHGTKLNLAVCEAGLGHLATAWQLLASLMKTLPPDDPRLDIVRERLHDLEPRVPHVRFEAVGRLPLGVAVRSGKLEISESGFGVPIPIDPGTHTFEVTAPGCTSRTYTITLAEGETNTLPISAPSPRQHTPDTAPLNDATRSRALSSRPGKSASLAKDTDAVERARAFRTWGILSLGAAGAALTTGSVAGLQAIERKERMDAECEPNGCSPEGRRAAREGGALASVSTMSFVAGAVLVGAGVTLLVLHSRTRQPGASSRLELGLSGLHVRSDF